MSLDKQIRKQSNILASFIEDLKTVSGTDAGASPRHQINLLLEAYPIVFQIETYATDMSLGVKYSEFSPIKSILVCRTLSLYIKITR